MLNPQYLTAGIGPETVEWRELADVSTCHRQAFLPPPDPFDDHVVTVGGVCSGRGVHPSATGSPEPRRRTPRAPKAQSVLRTNRASTSPTPPFLERAVGPRVDRASSRPAGRGAHPPRSPFSGT